MSVGHSVSHHQGLTYRIDRFQECIPKDIKRQISSGLNSTIGEAVVQIRISQVFLLDCKLLITNGKFHNWKLIEWCVGRESPTLYRCVVYPTWNGRVNGSGNGIIDQSERACRISDSSIVEQSDLSIAHRKRCARELPEALRIINICIMNCLPTKGLFVNETKRIKRLMVPVRCISVRAKIGGEDLLFGWKIVLDDQIFGRRGYRKWTDVIDISKCEAKQSVTRNILEGWWKSIS